MTFHFIFICSKSSLCFSCLTQFWRCFSKGLRCVVVLDTIWSVWCPPVSVHNKCNISNVHFHVCVGCRMMRNEWLLHIVLDHECVSVGATDGTGDVWLKLVYSWGWHLFFMLTSVVSWVCMSVCVCECYTVLMEISFIVADFVIDLFRCRISVFVLKPCRMIYI